MKFKHTRMVGIQVNQFCKCLLGAVLFLVLFLQVPLWAEDDLASKNRLHIGPVDLHPHLEFISAYDDNVMVTRNAQGDFSFVTTPGLQLVYGQTSQNFISLDYTASFERFLRLTSQDSDNQFVKLDSHFEVGRVLLGVSHLFQDIKGPNTQIGARVRSRDNVTHLNAEYELSSKTSFGIGYDQYLHDYMMNGLFDTQEYSPSLSFFYHMTPKADLFCRLAYGWVRADQSENATYTQADIGIRGKLTHKITGTARVGFQHRSFSGNLGDINTVVASLDLEAQLAQRTKLAFIVARGVNPSPSVVSNSYEFTRVECKLTHKLPGKKIGLWIGGLYERDDYQNPVGGVDRHDDFVEGTVGITYDITKRIELGAEYLFWHNGSTLEELQFTRNLVSVHARVHF